MALPWASIGYPFGAEGCSFDETVEAGLLFNPIEFDGVAVSEPVGDQVVRALRVFVAGDVGQADVILVVDTGEADFAGENFDFLRHG